jgi:hypothetical protein
MKRLFNIFNPIPYTIKLKTPSKWLKLIHMHQTSDRMLLPSQLRKPKPIPSVGASNTQFRHLPIDLDESHDGPAIPQEPPLTRSILPEYIYCGE